MPNATLNNKKFLDGLGAKHLYDIIKNRYDSKLDAVSAADESIVVTNNKDIRVRISTQDGNALQVITEGANKGLYVAPGGNSDSYAIIHDTSSDDYAAVYRLMKYAGGDTTSGTSVGVINIPKDMVVQSGKVENKAAKGEWGDPGVYIHLVLANAENSDIYIPASSLVEYVTSGSQATDMVVITIDDATHEVTASITDDSITAAKLAPALRQQIAAGATGIHEITEGSTNGTIAVDGDDVAVHGLGSAAYVATTAFDAAGAADAVRGTTADDVSANTVYGAYKYTSNAYDAIMALTNAEIDAAIAES